MARREGDQWPVRVEVGGGRIAGSLRLSAAGGGLHRLQGELQTTDVEVSALTAPSKPLTGKLQAQTTLRAEFRAAGQIADALKAAHGDGKLSSEEAASLKSMLIEKTLAKLSEPAYALLKSAAVDVEALISGAGESWIEQINAKTAA